MASVVLQAGRVCGTRAASAATSRTQAQTQRPWRDAACSFQLPAATAAHAAQWTVCRELTAVDGLPT